MNGTDADAEVNLRGPRGADNLGRTHEKKFSMRVKKLRRRGFRAAANACGVLGCRAMRVVEKRQLLSAEEIGRTLQRLAHEIVEKSGGTKDLALIGVRRRGVPLSQRIAAIIRTAAGVSVPVGTLDITLYRDDLSTVAQQPVVHSNEIDFPVDDRDIVLVDDVLYTGRTVRAAMNGLFDLGRPRRIRLCVLVDRGHRELPVEASFVGRLVETSDTEIVEVRLREIDGEERVMLVDRVT
ncbi:MAG: bifunctional pyr operon transcriptional regulator/uracil phosphoribosyltransferase PyrR [Candidatus Acidiferrales bacterium]